MTYRLEYREDAPKKIPVLFVCSGEAEEVGSITTTRKDPRDMVIVSFSDNPLEGGDRG